MEALRKIPLCAILLIFVVFSPKSSYGAAAGITELNEDNWDLMMENEWMVEFMAPWCPACSSLRPTWKQLAGRARELGIHVGEVDVTTSPGLSGRFLVTALPTIYHVLNGELRQYMGPRDQDSLIAFVTASKWKALPILPWWRSPSMPHMAGLSHFFKLSQVLRTIHNTLLETYGLPTYGSYLIFAIATIFLGALLGLIVVCMIDFLFPPKVRDRKPTSNVITRSEAVLIDDDLVDEDEEKEGLDEGDDSDAERNSDSDSLQSSEDHDSSAEEDDPLLPKNSDKKESDPDKKNNSSSPDIRKRKPKKAD